MTKNLSSNIHLKNSSGIHFSHKNLRLNFKVGNEDVIIKKRQKISEEAELEKEIINAIKTERILEGFNS